MLLFNTRRGGYNVKKFVGNYFNAQAYPNTVLPEVKATWVTESGNQDDPQEKNPRVGPFFHDGARHPFGPTLQRHDLKEREGTVAHIAKQLREFMTKQIGGHD